MEHRPTQRKCRDSARWMSGNWNTAHILRESGRLQLQEASPKMEMASC